MTKQAEIRKLQKLELVAEAMMERSRKGLASSQDIANAWDKVDSFLAKIRPEKTIFAHGDDCECDNCFDPW